MGKVLLFLAVVAAGGFGYAMYKYNESPQQVWRRLVEQMGFAKPSPVPTPTPAPIPTPTPTPESTPEPTATPQATPTPTPDPLTWLLDHKDYWPKEVTLLKEADFPAVFNGKVVGSAKVPAGTVVNLAEITGETVGVVYSGGSAHLPVAATDLRERAKVAMAKAAADAATVAEAARTGTKPADATPATPVAAGSPFPPTGNLVPTTISGLRQVVDLVRRRVILSGRTELHLTGTGDPLQGSVLNFTSPDAWLFMDKIPPSAVVSNFLSRMWVNGVPAELDTNIRVARYESGTVVIPHGPDFGAMQVFSLPSVGGLPDPLRCFVKYGDPKGEPVKTKIRSFRLKRGYMATIAEKENGSGLSKNYVAQDNDIEVKSLPPELDGKVQFIRIFPWRWTSKKGVAGNIWQKLNVGWFYDWNIGANSSFDIEYVPIKQKRWWPGLNQDWKAKGSTHLLGYNEPDRPDQAKMTVDEAIAGWPELLGTGLRVGSPAVSDGGLGWLYQFMEKADAANLRVDFVAVHYYRAVPPQDAKAAAKQFYNFCKGIHDRTKRPIWITEWNNGANWTNAGDPTEAQQKEAVREMIKVLDDAPFVERYAIYNWVEDVRHVVKKDGSLTPAGEVYRDKESPLSYKQK